MLRIIFFCHTHELFLGSGAFGGGQFVVECVVAGQVGRSDICGTEICSEELRFGRRGLQQGAQYIVQLVTVCCAEGEMPGLIQVIGVEAQVGSLVVRGGKVRFQCRGGQCCELSVFGV